MTPIAVPTPISRCDLPVPESPVSTGGAALTHPGRRLQISDDLG